MNRFSLLAGPNGALMQQDAHGAYVRVTDLAPMVDAFRALLHVANSLPAACSDPFAVIQAERALIAYETGTLGGMSEKERLNDARLQLAITGFSRPVPSIEPPSNLNRRSVLKRGIRDALNGTPESTSGQESRRRLLLQYVAEFITLLPGE
jgi:hypothetical protein